MQMDKVPLFTFLSERPLYLSCPISSTFTSCFYYTCWNSCFIVDQLLDLTDIFLKCFFPSLTWFSLITSALCFHFLFLHLMYGVGGPRVGKRVTYSVFLLPPPAFPCHLVKPPLLKYTLHLNLVAITIDWHGENSPTWPLNVFLTFFFFLKWYVCFMPVQKSHTFKT